MKKTTIAAISAALLLCAVLCTAGCVEAPSDPIVGTYVTETDSSVSYAVFENDGTGCFAEAATAETGDAAGVLQGTFTWTAAEQKMTYTLTFADGAAETAALDAEHGHLTIGDVVYQKEPSALSGAMVLEKLWAGGHVGVSTEQQEQIQTGALSVVMSGDSLMFGEEPGLEIEEHVGTYVGKMVYLED